MDAQTGLVVGIGIILAIAFISFLWESGMLDWIFGGIVFAVYFLAILGGPLGAWVIGIFLLIAGFTANSGGAVIGSLFVLVIAFLSRMAKPA